MLCACSRHRSCVTCYPFGHVSSPLPGKGGLFDNETLMKALLSVPVPPDTGRATSGVQIARRALKQLLGHVDCGRLKWDTRISLSIEHCKGCECVTILPPLFCRNILRRFHRHVCWHSEDVYVKCAALLQKAVSLVLHGFDVDVVVRLRKRAPT